MERNIRPTVTAANRILDIALRLKYLEKFDDFFAYMKKANYEPDAYTYGTP